MTPNLFSAAHFNARWKRASGDRRPYRVIFAEALRLGWAKAKTRARPFPTYIPRPHTYMRSPRYISAVGE